MKKLTALEMFYEFMKNEGREPELEEWIDWGFSEKYYYQVRRKFRKRITEEVNVNE